MNQPHPFSGLVPDLSGGLGMRLAVYSSPTQYMSGFEPPVLCLAVVLSGRRLAAQARGVLGSTPSDCRHLYFHLNI